VHLSVLVKYLGVVLDSQLSWREAVKGKKAYNLLGGYCGATWGLKPKVVYLLSVFII
jgi:hypothetical protein